MGKTWNKSDEINKHLNYGTEDKYFVKVTKMYQ